MFYFFKWPSDSKDNILNFESKKIIDIENRAKISGKLLAYILASPKFFKDFQINLIGFSLGNRVIESCINELAEIYHNKNKFVNLKNVIMIAGALHFEDSNRFKKNIEEIVVDKFINCHSREDYTLKQLYQKCSDQNAIGNNALILNDNKGKNLVSNYDFTSYSFGHFSYNYMFVVERIFSKYIDI